MESNTPDLFSSFLDNVSLSIIIIDKQQKVVFWNFASEELFGYSIAETLGVEISKLIIPDYIISQEDHAKYVRSFFRGEASRTIGLDTPLEAKTKDGSFIPIEIRVCKIKSQGIPYVAGIIRNISDKTKLIKELKDQNIEIAAVKSKLELLNDQLKLEKDDAVYKLNRAHTQDKLAIKMLYSILSLILITLALSSFTNIKESAVTLSKDATLLLIGTFGGAISSVYGIKKAEENSKNK